VAGGVLYIRSFKLNVDEFLFSYKFELIEEF
jgi:hypothetical protein